jgi:hypothetical protein
MSKTPKFVVWTWLRDDQTPAYVGWGEFTIAHPAKHVWNSRDLYDSALNEWLRSLDKEPKRDTLTPSIPFHKREARAIATAMRKAFREEGHNVLESRPSGTYNGGGGAKRVRSPDLTIYDSVRQAAEANGVSPSTISRWCQAADSEWFHIAREDSFTHENQD